MRTPQLPHPLLLQAWTKAPAPDPSKEGTDKDVRSTAGEDGVTWERLFFGTEESAVFPNKATNHGVPEGEGWTQP